MSCVTREEPPGVCTSLGLAGTALQRFETAKTPEPLPVMYFLCAWLAIAGISAYDAYLVQVFQPVIRSMEQNPVCLMLINWDPEQLSYFLVAKAAGTLTVLTILAALYCWKRRLALSVITGVMTFQVGLLMYLSFAQN